MVHDLPTFLAVPACLLAIALLAGYLPARRTTKSIRLPRCDMSNSPAVA